MENKAKKMILAGGGTGGSVSPLLAVAQALKVQGDFEFLFVGTKNGPERQMAEKAGIPFKAISAGKMRRYFDWRNFSDIFKIKLGFYQSLFLMIKDRPKLVLSAGSFAAVPVVWAAWVLRIPCLVHQMDLRPGLANRLMAPFAKIVSVSFEKSLGDYGRKAVWTGNPSSIINYKLRIINEGISKKFGLKDDLPVVFVVGGGTGAEGINRLVEGSLPELMKFCQMIHSTGHGKMTSAKNENYHAYEFLDAEEMAAALSAADLVVTRAGIGTLTDIAAFKKPAIIIPMPDSHQEDNARYFAEKGAGIFLNQRGLGEADFAKAIKDLLDDDGARKKLSENIGLIAGQDAGQAIASLAKKYLD